MQPFKACDADRQKGKLVSGNESAIEKAGFDEMVCDEDGVVA
jgi:hypothetical protein